MSQWLESPLTITAIVGTLGLLIAVVGVVWKLGQWKGGVDEHRKTMEDHRTTVAEFMKEIRDDFRDDIKKLFQGPSQDDGREQEPDPPQRPRREGRDRAESRRMGPSARSHVGS